MYVPHTAAEQEQMLQRIGCKYMSELFDSIPQELRRREDLDLPPALSEMELQQHMESLSRNVGANDTHLCFLGGGCYDHFVPAVVDFVASRSEFYTAYTPYQPEASQGTLQVGFEYQTLMAQLSGMDLSNSSLYDGASALAEAALVLLGSKKNRKRLLVSDAVHPEWRQTLVTYLANMDAEIVVIPSTNGVADPDVWKKAIDETVAGVVVQSPNFFGSIEPVADISQLASEHGVSLIQAFDPISTGFLKRPGDLGASIAIAEGQSLGTPLSFGGPFLGIFCCQKEFLRQVPGRLVGETVDKAGKRAFVLTLQTREQHIRRERATSNICTNQGLLALRATVYLSLLGPQGLRETADLCWHKSHYAAEQLASINGVSKTFDAEFFKEFVVTLPHPAEQVVEKMARQKIHAGIALSRWFSDRPNDLLVAVTERRTREEIDQLRDALRYALAN